VAAARESHFACDGSAFEAPARQMLRALSDCFIQGHMSGRSIRLVGHTDPRGADDYNRLLGQRRADVVKQQLTFMALNADAIETSSRGGMDATGHDGPSRADHRRVDVQ
jgi:peptidoglycan-associated lipoprotein